MSSPPAPARVRLASQTSTGRLPWYNKKGQPFEPYIIGIAGGSGSGKTSVASKIITSLGVPWVVLLCMDSYYKSLNEEQLALAAKNEYNFDHPDSFDYDALYDTLYNLKKGCKVEVPIYDFKTHTRLKDKTRSVYGANVIIFEGIFALYDKKVRNLMDLQVFVDTDSDIRLARRLKRDIAERGRELASVLGQYSKFVKPAYDDYIHPTMKYADVIIPRGLDNTAAMDLIRKHVLRQLNERGMMFLRNQLAMDDVDQPLPSSLIVLQSTPQMEAIHTIIRDRQTSRHDFIFYSDRLSRRVIERGLDELPYEQADITTPLDRVYKGTLSHTKLCGVSIVRAGATMEQALRSVIHELPVGKILIQTDQLTGEPSLHYLKLPSDIQDRYVMLTDATLATGAAALMAIRVLLEHQVPEDHIIFLCLIAAPPGIHTIAGAFPLVRMVTSCVDPKLNESFHIIPGIGNFGDRYFGT